jgi:hypothetical protein
MAQVLCVISQKLFKRAPDLRGGIQAAELGILPPAIIIGSVLYVLWSQLYFDAD